LALGSQLCELPDAEAIRCLMSNNLRKDTLEGMEICGQYFSRETLRRIEGELEREPGLSRRELARRVCRWLEWRSPKGQLKEMSCRKALVANSSSSRRTL